MAAEKKAHIGVTGLAVMGANLARNFAHHGYTVALHNRSEGKTTALMEEHGSEGDFIPTETMEELVDSLEKPRRVLIMVKAGAPVDSVIEQLTPLLDEGDIIIDGGNSYFQDTRRRERECAEKGLHFVGVGVSGGEEGALNGPSIMPGGSEESYKSLGPMLEDISAKADDGTPCCAWIGTDGAGHFVKMVHNGIEYADMQVIGEAHELLRSVAGLEPAEQADVFEEWNATELSSYLIEITAQVLRQVDSRTGKPFIDVVADAAGQKGTGRWTVQEALELGSPVTAIAESVFARALSSSEPVMRKEAQEVLPAGIGDTTEDVVKDPGFVEDVRKALYASKLVSYAQGLDMLTMAGREYGWQLDLATIASLWRNGCIIRAELLNVIMAAYQGDKAPLNLLFAPEFITSIEDALPSWRRVVARAVERGIPAPVFSSALAYYDALRRPRLNAALTQGLRDYFGAHTYKRIDDPDSSFHVLWSGDRSEVVS
ncbi:NADP-dependent phosphogluconate dehydrogenase [Kocuria marina]|uniref:6-phosphogluconate dehydrogenase, decarboxylating n=1 Tax=Kocuria marina subsp. indica TaxID=1049583 RepID=A0A1X7C2L9_9MICC|nr:MULTISPECIES: NADP-dependent phosphogluconate dehydrogenase [Kocuria]MBN6811239.1 NADP-dependent phosphogluconate dehydrogenase [Kocuria indica]MBN6842864.1 NADP-dependent phosphogluconate dehydrogenase [Kocuria indica]MCT2360809.1 NADP-dependent phosphogluconate dehydrogenase [Kocuria marina]OXS85768.1 phosphogluconate dehydrogenase (NADP(+)-dependent, decarboxylating) [Kocuria indica]RLP59511.1 NADP-dependent phosphogluconate dehydrogenase [Kocuria indica]